MTKIATDYEKEVKSAKLKRNIGYTVLWFFLGAFTAFLSWGTGRNYPMTKWMVAILILIGIAKLVETIRYYRNQ